MMRLLLFVFFFVPSVCLAVTTAQYSVQASAGASYDAMMGIIMSNVAPKFSATAAGDAVQAVKSAPLSISTPYGPASGTLQTAGSLSRAAVGNVAKSLARSLPYVSVGMALYDAYNSAGLSVDTSGQVVDPSSVPSIPSSSWTYNGVPYSSSSVCSSPGYSCGSVSYSTSSTTVCAFGPCYQGSVPQMNVCCGVIGIIPVFAPASSSVSQAATTLQKDAAIDAAIAADIALAARLADQAWNAGQTFPAMSVIQSVPKQSFQTDWYQTAAYRDVLNNLSMTETQAVIEFDPASVPTLNDPIPMKITENKRTSTNGTSTGSSSSIVASQASGNTTATAPNSPLQPQNQTDCDKFPDSVGCLSNAQDLPDVSLTDKTISVSINPVAMGGGGSCPGPVQFGSGSGHPTWEWTPYCNFANGARPIILTFAWLIAAYIVIGVRSDA